MGYVTIVVSETGTSEAHHEGWVRKITLNRPARRNAMNRQMQEELIAALEDAATSKCRVVVIAGAGETFCSGLDLSALQAVAQQTPQEHRADAEMVARLFRAIYEMPKPTIAAVQGAAIAGGTGLATICDFTVAVPAAKFGYTEARIGFVPALVSAFLTLRIGEKRARGLLLSGRLFDAEEAYRMGLVDEVVDPAELTSRVSALAELLAANSPESLAATKRLLAAQNKGWLDQAIAHSIDASVEARATADFREGVATFLEKRRPVWDRR